MNGYQVHWNDGQNWKPNAERERLLEWNYDHQQFKHSGMNFAFQKRTASIDWRKIAAADVDVITRTMDFNALQDNIINVAFCDIERELLLQQVDPTYVKVFQLAQLTIEYLLHSQEFLLSQLQESQLLLNQSNEELQKFKPEMGKLNEELNDVKKESHKRKKIIATQQMIMKIGKDSYNKCPYCEKAFMNQSFLTAHIRNRHSKESEIITSDKVPLISAGEDKENVAFPASGKHLEKEMKALKDQLRQLERQLVEERRAKNAMILTKSDKKTQEELETWKKSQLQDHEDELKRLKESFLREINELNEKKRSADEALIALQRRKGQGVSAAMGDHESTELRRQREEVAQLREELIIQKIDVVKLKEMLQEKLNSADRKPKSKRRRLDGKIGDIDTDERKALVQSLGHQQTSEPPQQQSRLDDNDITDSDDDDDEDEMLLTEASNFEGSAALLSQRTFPTIDSMTMSLTEPGLSSYRPKLDKNSTLMMGFRQEAEQELETRLERWGIYQRMRQINSSTLESVTRSMKTERTQKAKSLRNFYDIRNQYVTTVDQVAKENLVVQTRNSQQQPQPLLQQQEQQRKQQQLLQQQEQQRKQQQLLQQQEQQRQQQQGQLRKQASYSGNQGPASSAIGSVAATTKSSAPPAQGNMAASVSSTGQSFSEIGITYTSTGSSYTAGSLSVKDLDSDDDDDRKLPAKVASAAMDRSGRQPPSSVVDRTKQTQSGVTPQPTKRETVPAPRSGRAEPGRNDDSDWDEISEIPIDANQGNPTTSSSAVKATGSSLLNSQTRPIPSPRARNVEMGSLSSLEDAASPRNFATSQNLQRHTLPRSIMHSTQEPSFTGSLTKGKKLKNSVTFSDDLESTEEALSVRDL